METTIAKHGGGRCPRCRSHIAKGDEIARPNPASPNYHLECVPEPGKTDADLVDRLERDARNRKATERTAA